MDSTTSTPPHGPPTAAADGASGHAAGARAGTGGNVDPAEVERFGRMAAEWWDPNGAFRPLHRLAPARLGFIREVVTSGLALAAAPLRPLEGVRLIDIGCGGGLVCEPLARLGARVTGIDLAEDSIAAARTHAAAGGLAIDYRAESIEAVAASGERFDVALCLEVLEHVPDPAAFLAAAAAVLEPGGLMVASTINRTTKSYLLAIVGAEYVLGWLPRGTHQWDRFITPDELESHLRAAGLTPQRREGVVYDPLRDVWSRSPDTGVNYQLSARKL